jgi:hypothetical protein
MGIATLKEQLSEAFIIARNHENKLTQNAIEAYLDKIIKLSPLIMTRNIAPQNQYYLKNQDAQDNFATIPTPTKTIYAPKNQQAVNNFSNFQTNNLNTPNQTPKTNQISPINNAINKNETIRKVKFVFKGQIQSANPKSTQKPVTTIIPNNNYQKINPGFSPIATSKIIETSHYSQSSPTYIVNKIDPNQNKISQKPLKRFKFRTGPDGVI